MKHPMLRASLALFISVAAGLPVAAYASCSNVSDQKIQNIIDQNRVKFDIPGIQVSLLCPEESQPRDYVSGNIKIDSNIPVRQDHLFQIGSETKSFIAAILLQLDTEGTISLNDYIEKWLPMIPASWHGITITQLLNHTSGLYNYTDELIELFLKNQVDINKQWSAPELISLVKDKDSYFEPGKGWHYSNTNYVLAGMIIEAASGESVLDAMNNRLIYPSGLMNTYYVPALYSGDILKRMSHGYSKSGLFPDEPKDVTEINASTFNAAGANISTSHDMSLWFKKLMKGDLLNQTQLAKLMTLVDVYNGQPLPNSPTSSGYGLAVVHDQAKFNEEAWWHTGGTLGYTALMVWLKCNDVIITINISDMSTMTQTESDMDVLANNVVTYVQKSTGKPQCRINNNNDNNNEDNAKPVKLLRSGDLL